MANYANFARKLGKLGKLANSAWILEKLKWQQFGFILNWEFCKCFSQFSQSRPKIYHEKHFGNKNYPYLEFQSTNLTKPTKHLAKLVWKKKPDCLLINWFIVIMKSIFLSEFLHLCCYQYNQLFFPFNLFCFTLAFVLWRNKMGETVWKVFWYRLFDGVYSRTFLFGFGDNVCHYSPQ